MEAAIGHGETLREQRSRKRVEPSDITEGAGRVEWETRAGWRAYIGIVEVVKRADLLVGPAEEKMHNIADTNISTGTRSRTKAKTKRK